MAMPKGGTSPAKGKKQGVGARSPRAKRKKDALPSPITQTEMNRALSGLPLTNGRRKFVEEYIIDEDTLKAAARAGFSTPEYGFQLISDPIVSQAIAIAKAKRMERTHITADKTLRELAWIGYCDPEDAFDENDNLRPLRQMPEHLRHAIASVTVKRLKTKKIGEDTRVEEELVSVKFWNKNEALVRLGRAQGVPLGADGSFQFNFTQNTVNVTPEGSYLITRDQISMLPPPVRDALLYVIENNRPPAHLPIGLKELPAPPITIESIPDQGVADETAPVTDMLSVRGTNTTGGDGDEWRSVTVPATVPTPPAIHLPDASNTTHIPGTVADS